MKYQSRSACHPPRIFGKLAGCKIRDKAWNYLARDPEFGNELRLQIQTTYSPCKQAWQIPARKTGLIKAAAGTWSALLLLQAIFVMLYLPGLCLAADPPFDRPANWGGTGLFEIPTARVLGDGHMRLGFAQALPYRWYTFAISPLPRLELSGRYTEITNRESGLEPDYGSYKDKAFDVKYQLVAESRALPAVAVGLHDFHGTKMFKAEYIALSRQLYPLDLTLGIGRGRLEGDLSVFDEFGLWGGLTLNINRRWQLVAEYNPVEYEQDPEPVRGVAQGASWPLNLGLRWQPVAGIDLGLSLQRGDTLGFSFNWQFGLGKRLLPPRPDPPSWDFAFAYRKKKMESQRQIDAVCKAIAGLGFKDVSVYRRHARLVAEFENDRYLDQPRAVGRAMRLMLHHSPPDISYLTVILKRRRLRWLQVSTGVSDLKAFLMGNTSLQEFSRNLEVTHLSLPGGKSPARCAAQLKDFTELGIDPAIESFFNDPSGAFKYRLALKPHATVQPLPGTAFNFRYDIPLYSQIESSNQPPEDAVRSDNWKYMGNNAAVDRLMMDQVFRLNPAVFGRFSAGYLERMYAGAGGELLGFLPGGSIALGIEADWVRKRDPDSQFGLLDQENHTLLGNFYYRHLPLDLTFRLQYGRFLAGDTGFRIDVRRRFDTGAEFGLWYSFTDTDRFSGFNQGYHDKGIYLRIPWQTFSDSPSRTMLEYRMRPWTRDVGAVVDHWQEVFDLGSDLQPAVFRNYLGKMSK